MNHTCRSHIDHWTMWRSVVHPRSNLLWLCRHILTLALSTSKWYPWRRVKHQIASPSIFSFHDTSSPFRLGYKGQLSATPLPWALFSIRVPQPHWLCVWSWGKCVVPRIVIPIPRLFGILKSPSLVQYTLPSWSVTFATTCHALYYSYSRVFE